jgi:tripartite-type tricarboxylate transporter receptor subunit TctC
MTSRRVAIGLFAIGFVALVWPASGASALDYPSRPVRFVVGYPPGGATDILARLIGHVMTVNNNVPAKTVAEFIAYAKANPGKVNMASSGNGTSVHLSGEMFMSLAGVKMQHVPYRGAAPALTDMLGGQVQVIFDNMPSVIQHIRSGALRALAVTTTTRSPQLPDVPTVAETVPGYEASALFGVGAPKKTPPEIIEKLNKDINEVLAESDIKARLIDLGGEPLISTPDAFGKMVVAETEKWEKVVKAAGAHIE